MTDIPKTDLNTEPEGHKDFNYYITKFFLNNSRLTVLALLLLVFLGLAATLMMKTTGFPDPEVKIALVTATYQGASSETVSKDVTQPLEGAIKDVDGVKNYVSTSSNSFATISVTIDQNANADSVRSKLDSAIKSIALPTGVDNLKLTTPQVGGPDFIFSIAGTDKEKLFNAYDRFNTDLTQIPETSKITPISEIKRRVLVVLDKDKLKNLDITIDQVQNQLKSIGETLPVVSGATIDGESKSVTTKLNVENIDDIKDFRINIAQPGSSVSKTYKLTDLAEVKLDYYFSDKTGAIISNAKEAGQEVSAATIFTVRAAKGTDKAAYAKKFEEKIKDYSDVTFVRTKEEIPTNAKDIVLVENFSVNDSSKEQVDEVISGLIGGPLKLDNPVVANLGWLLGGIQLVFLAMLAFVSWRAALIAAVSIPLSLVFSNIYLYFRGENLNTLVLFSLVLVIGLVVDPSLVILESIQRKVDTGIKGNKAVLEAVIDVGPGLFLAALTNIIVFAPFGVISGVLGQIFSYIPATIIPATIGSYIVPLVFLAWIGGLFLKPSKEAHGSEEENLWPIAKWLMKTNKNILEGSVWLRTGILVLALVIPFVVVGFYFGSGKIRSVQFSASQNTNQVSMRGTFKSTLPQADRQIVTRQVLERLSKENAIEKAFPQTAGFNYYISLKEARYRPGLNTVELSKKWETELKNEFGQYFFDFSVGAISNGPPAGGYQVAIGVKTDDLVILEKAAKDIGQTMQNICRISTQKIVIDPDCKNGTKIVTKIDDGYTGKENKELDLVLDRQKLYDNNLASAQGAITGYVNQQITQLFTLAGDKKIGTIKVQNDDVEVFLDKAEVDPHTLEDISGAKLKTTTGTQLDVSSVSEVVEKAPKDTISRVKGQTIGAIQARLSEGNNDQGSSALVTTAILNYYKANDGEKIRALGLKPDSIEQYSEGSSADFIKSFQELLLALVLAIFITYVVLALFFGSLTQPLVIIFTIPMAFIGVFPALAAFTPGEFGFLEIIGFIILVGVVENVAIFLIDAANQKIRTGWDEKTAIVYASGVRTRSVLLTKITAIASLAPLAFLSEFYRSISIVIIFGLLASGFVSLITTPILYIFFRWSSRTLGRLIWWQKILFFLFYPVAIIVVGYQEGNLDFKWLKEQIRKFRN
jgi:HAE1 family hydrophobic/amphiphilic exporter-1